MALVNYSDSEDDSSNESPAPNTSKPTPKPDTKPPTTATSSASAPPPRSKINRLVDRANPTKLKVNLPTAPKADDVDKDAPPAKKQRTGGGFGGFNDLLPKPKRTGVKAGGSGTTGDEAGEGKRGLGRGLGSGVSLKTASKPGFLRRSAEEQEADGEYGWGEKEYDEYGKEISGSGSGATGIKEEEGQKVQNEAQEVKLVGKPMMFKPLSVVNKGKKKKSSVAALQARNAEAKEKAPAMAKHFVTEEVKTTDATSGPEAAPKPTPKTSLFSFGGEDVVDTSAPAGTEYQPMLHTETTEESSYPTGAYTQTTTSSTQPVEDPNSAASFANNLNLTPAERRQLFGRKGASDPSSIQMVNFNTDEQYAENQKLMASGEQVMHNPVRGIKPGKHTLQQLVNAASNQREALEEHFQKGKNSRKEAGSKYGW